MRKIIKYLEDYKKESIIGPLFKMLEAIFELLVPVIMALVIDIGIKNNDHKYIYQRGLILILLGLIGLVCSLTAQYFAAVASVGFGTKIRKDMFAHINRLSYSELDMVGTSTLITRIIWCKYGVASFFTLSIYRNRCSYHGLYNSRKDSTYLFAFRSDSFNYNIRNCVLLYPSI